MMRVCLLLFVLISSAAHSFYLESDFADSEFSIKGRALDYSRASNEAFEGTTYIAQVEVLDVYYGDISVGDKIELIIFSDDMLKSLYRDYILEGEFASNFCISSAGVYFTDRLYKPRKKTIEALEQFSRSGTEYWDRHDCNDLRHSRMDPDSLEYAAPQLNHGGNHSAKFWKQKTDFMEAYNDAVKSTVNPDWVDKFEGIGRSRETHVLDGLNWLHISFCDYESCRLHNMNILYSEQSKKAVALIADEATYFVGNPNSELISLLLTLNDNIYSSRGSIEKRFYEPGYYDKVVQNEKKRRENRTTTQKLIGTLIDIYIED